MAKKLTPIKGGEFFKVGINTSRQTFQCLGERGVRLVCPSKDQCMFDEAFRSGAWKKTAHNEIEAEWYRQRGYEYV